MEFVPDNKEFYFKGLCPYCKGDLTYTVDGMIEDEDGLWKADNVEAQCSNEPNIETDAWNDWFASHSDMPYVYQLPVDENVKEYINSKYRFIN
ncbi:MAG TPA: hypothetical protein VFM70_10735 [Salinimicrobium sp.]|nr:hypothetical protein [Salinimicrobium sp.]